MEQKKIGSSPAYHSDVAPLLGEEVQFLEVMKTLASHFKYAEEKKKLKRS